MYTRGASNARAGTQINLDAASLTLSNSSYIAFRDAASNVPHYVLGVATDDNVRLSSPANSLAMFINSGDVKARTDIGYANSNPTYVWQGTSLALSTEGGAGDVRVHNNLGVTGRLSSSLGLQVTTTDPGALVERNYGASNDRYGVGQFGNGTTRMYASDAFSISTLALGYALSNGTFNDRITVNRNQTTLRGDLIATTGNTIRLGSASTLLMGSSNVTVEASSMELEAASLKLIGNQTITLQSPTVRLTNNSRIAFDDSNGNPNYVLGVSSGDDNVRLINTASGNVMYVNPGPSASELQINVNNPDVNGTTFFAHSNAVCRINNDGLEVLRGQIKLPENSIPYKSLKGDGDKLIFGHRFGEQGYELGVGGAYMLTRKWQFMEQVNNRSKYAFAKNDFRDDRNSQLSNISCCVHVHMTNYVSKVGYIRFVLLTPSVLMSEKRLVVEAKMENKMDRSKFGAFIDNNQPHRPIYVTCDPYCYVSFTVHAGY